MMSEQVNIEPAPCQTLAAPGTRSNRTPLGDIVGGTSFHRRSRPLEVTKAGSQGLSKTPAAASPRKGSGTD
jgi:hypothetical protein